MKRREFLMTAAAGSAAAVLPFSLPETVVEDECPPWEGKIPFQESDLDRKVPVEEFSRRKGGQICIEDFGYIPDIDWGYSRSETEIFRNRITSHNFHNVPAPKLAMDFYFRHPDEKEHFQPVYDMFYEWMIGHARPEPPKRNVVMIDLSTFPTQLDFLDGVYPYMVSHADYHLEVWFEYEKLLCNFNDQDSLFYMHTGEATLQHAFQTTRERSLARGFRLEPIS